MATRAQINQARQSITETRSQIKESRGNIQSSREKVTQGQQSLRRPKRVPFTPRKERFARSKFKQSLGAASQELSETEKQLTAQEQEVQSYETYTLDPADRELKKIEEYNAAVSTIERAADKGMVWAHAAYGDGIVQKLAKKWLKLRSLAKQDYQKQQDLKLPAWFDPATGKQVLQSMDPNIAKQKGLIPIELKSFDQTTGKSIIESKTGLLTPTQLAARDFYSKVGRINKVDIPTMFEFGGDRQKRSFQEIIQPPKSAYDVAARTVPYIGKRAKSIEYKKDPIAFEQKYGYAVDEEGNVAAMGGGASGVINVGPPRKKGESIPEWYGRTIRDKESAGSAFNLALLATGYPVVKSGGAAALRGAAWRGSYLLSDPITETTSNIVESLIPQKETGFSLLGAPRQIARGGTFFGLASNPVVGPAFAAEILKSAVVDPIETVKNLKDYFLKNPYEAATVVGLGRAELRARQRMARSKMYYEVVDKLEVQYGPRAIEVTDFKKAWKRAFEELPKRSDIVQRWTSKDLEVIKGDKKLTKIIDEINSKYKPEIIGSTTITPQTSLKQLPRGKAGDIDVQNVPSILRNNSKKMAYEIYNRLKREGYNVRISEGDFFGNPKYYITLNGKELINIGTSTNYFLKTQLGPLRGLFETERLGQFISDPITGVKISGIRGQLRVKLAKGYGGDTSRIRQLKKLAEEGKLVGREKDIIDAMGIVKGTDFLIKEGRYVGPTQTLTAGELLTGAKESVAASARGGVIGFENLLTGRKPAVKDYGYYEGIPTKARKTPPTVPKYQKPKYDPASYLVTKYPTPYKAPKTQYKQPYSPPTNYLIPQYAQPRKAPYRQPKKPKYNPPTNYLTQQYPQPRKAPPYSPPVKAQKPPAQFTSMLIPTKPRRKPSPKKKRKKKGYKTLPTLTQQLMGYKGTRAKSYVTGFETVRII